MKTIRLSKLKYCRSHFAKGLGLRFHKPIQDEAYVFLFEKPTKAMIDMLFVFFPIDLVFLDNNKRVIELKENFRPFGFYMPKEKFSYLVELKDGLIKKLKIRIGDEIHFKD